jgi:hypothetical protein
MPNARLWTLRFGFYIERERHRHEDVHSVDPITRQPSRVRAPLPPPTPPPPLPTPPDEHTTWPTRMEE